MEHYNVNQLLARLLLGKASEKECAELEKRANKNEVQQIIDADDLADRYQYYAEADLDQALSEMQERMSRSYTRTKLLSPRFYRIAAVIALLLVGGAFLYYHDYTRVTPPEIAEEVKMAMQQSIQSGKQDAVEERVNTEDFIWSYSNKGKDKIDDSDSKVSSETDDKILIPVIQESLTKKQLLAARRITTKHDKEFWLTLDDGTLVHLNYNTRLIYPEKFGRGDRNVILEGEAYFMVAKDRSRPFIVHTPQGDVKVYGTEFYIKTTSSTAYDNSEEKRAFVVLLQGSVSFTPVNGKELVMQPGQQLTIDNERIIVNTVDTVPYLAWNEGKFIFKDWSLERILNVLSLWYNKDVVFRNETHKKINLSGNLYRYNSLQPSLKALETVAGVKIRINGYNTIIVE